MPRIFQRIGNRFNAKRFSSHNFIYRPIIKRSIADRSFRLANFGDLEVVQPFIGKIKDGYFGSFSRTTETKDRDMEKQFVIDLSHEQGYKRGHIKNAVNLPREKFDFCRPIDTFDGIHQDEVYSVFKALGVSNDTSEIILYDNSGLLACRLWFVLRYFGFNNVRILNGGWRQWLNSGLPVDESNVTAKPSNKSLDMKPKRKDIITRPTQLILDHEHDTSKIIDTRNDHEYQAYHIPRSMNIPSMRFMQDGVFGNVEQIRQIMKKNNVKIEDGADKIILYSNQGLTASVAYFCLTMAGIDKCTVYDQGLQNWIQNENDWEMFETDVDENHWRGHN